MRCYRHPDRETYVSCSDCGRGICPDCMTYGPGGHPLPRPRDVGGKTAAPKRAARTSLALGLRPVRHVHADRDQRRALRARARDRRPAQRNRELDLREGCPRLDGRRLVGPGRGCRRGRVVATHHRGVPPLRAHPPRDEHARALVHRAAARGVLRPRALPARLSRVGSRRIGRCADLVAERTHGRRVGGDLGDHGRRARPRGAQDLGVRRPGDGSRDLQPRDHLRHPRDLDRRPRRRARRRRSLRSRVLELPRARPRSPRCRWPRSASRASDSRSPRSPEPAQPPIATATTPASASAACAAASRASGTRYGEQET